MNPFLALTMKFPKTHSAILLFNLLVALAAVPAFAETPPIHHRLQVDLDPKARTAKIEDRMQLVVTDPSKDRVELFLNAELTLETLKTDAPVRVRQAETVAQESGPRLTRIEIEKPENAEWPRPLSLLLRYAGPVFDPQIERAPAKDGVLLSGQSYYYPQRIDPERLPDRMTFELNVKLPQGYKAVSQGAHHAAPEGETRWKSPEPMEEIFLIADRYFEFTERHGNTETQAFLLQDDPGLAQRYLKATRDYLDFYSRLIAPYPFAKFALVENRFETGYGMSSFTLLGSRVIRFPFILHTSYPHEILHNWWGNSVYIDFQKGNWAEGLTAYLADHLLLDVKGQGAQYRFQELMKYLNYVHPENDFPLTQFRSRTSQASQAVGYGKTLMVLHMLKNRLGREVFLDGLRDFYQKNRFRFAGWAELQASMQSVSGQDLTAYFEQWTQRKGAPQLKLTQAAYTKQKNGYRLTIELAQQQQEAAFALQVPVAIWLKGEREASLKILNMREKNQTYTLDLAAEPGRVRVDPHTDVFRRLDRREVPPSIGETLGSQSPAKLLPEKEAFPDVLMGYHELAQALGNSGPVAGPLLNDAAKSPVPPGSLWVFGRENRYVRHLLPLLKNRGVVVGEESVTIEGKRFPWKDHSFVFTLKRPGKRAGSVTWIVAAHGASVPGLIRKLPHYGKYGYLVFKGDAPDNQLKGRWPPQSAGLGKTFHAGDYTLPASAPLVAKGP